MVENILIIGNGFDLGHGYPTSYVEFADIVDSFISLYENETIMATSGLMCTSKPKYDYLDWFLFSFENYSDEFYNLIKDNCWINLFNEKYNKLKLGEYWYDLEQIIKEEINNLCSAIILQYKRERVVKDFNRFRRAFEIFIVMFIKFSKERQNRYGAVKTIEGHIKKIEPKYVINYNYTDTFSKLYDDNVKIDYLHGKAKLEGTVDDCNIVFGINEITLFERKDSYVEFTKEYQCEKFNIMPKYIKCLSGKDYNLHIYGHSLEETDRESLVDIFTQINFNNMYIWAFNEKDYKNRCKVLERTLGDKFDILKCKLKYKKI